MSAKVPANPPNPRTAATTARRKKVMTQFSMLLSLCGFDVQKIHNRFYPCGMIRQIHGFRFLLFVDDNAAQLNDALRCCDANVALFKDRAGCDRCFYFS